ncbi:MAG TPA: hypothetical protein VFC19_48090 [Candidatus Limnocylindrales bacterium]|nr:hypothetical protein [Candidatus Limnocylindrales bacterium]
MKVFAALGLVAGLLAAPVPVVSNFENATGYTLARDCGYSVRLTSGQTLWLFCDTATLDPAGQVVGFIGGTTAAISASAAAGPLSELPTPPAAPTLPNSNGPQRFLPVPAGLVLPNGSPCGSDGASYAASWLSGATRGPARTIGGYRGQDLVMLTYADVCVREQFTWTVQAFGLSFYHPPSNTFVAHHRVFATGAGADLAWQRQLGSPVFAGDGYLYLYASRCDSSAFGACGEGRTLLARTPWRNSQGWSRPESYRYWSPSGWKADPGAAASVMAGARPLSVDVRSYPGSGLAAIEQTTIAGHYRIWRASSLAGPWTPGPEAQLPDCASTAQGWCYAFVGHPELSTGTALQMSYYDPDNEHVMLTAVAW